MDMLEKLLWKIASQKNSLSAEAAVRRCFSKCFQNFFLDHLYIFLMLSKHRFIVFSKCFQLIVDFLILLFINLLKQYIYQWSHLNRALHCNDSHQLFCEWEMRLILLNISRFLKRSQIFCYLLDMKADLWQYPTSKWRRSNQLTKHHLVWRL